jgi:DNA helicase HerA-like ATPase
MTRRAETLAELAERNDLLDDPGIRRLLLAAGLSSSERLENAASKAVLGKSIQHWRYPFDPEKSSGGIRLGETFRNRPFHLSQEDLVKHFLTVGQSGSGKTTLFYNLAEQLEVPVWFFDLKQDYRHLAQENEFLVLPWTQLRFNPLQPPPGVPPRRWAQVFAEIFGHATALLSGSKNYLMKGLIGLYRLYGLFDEVSEPYPSLHELETFVEAEKINYVRKTSNYRDTLLNRLEAMNLVAGTVFDCSRGYPIEELLQRNVVFEFDGLSRDVQNFLTEILFAYVYEYRLAENQRGQGLNHVFFLDEGKRIFSVYKERQDAAGIPEIDQLTAKMREFGEGLVVADQEASKLTDSIKANTYTKILLPTGDRKQFNAIADSMNLSKKQTDFASDLGTGEAIIRVGSGSPVPVKLDDHQIEKTVSDEELESLQARNWSQLTHEPRETTPKYEQRIAPGRSEEIEETEVVDDPSEVEVSSDTDRFLEDVVENPFKPLTERYQLFSSSYMGNKAKNEAVDQGLVIERHVKTQNGKRKLLEFTEKGRKYVKNSLSLETKQGGRGGIVHQYWQHRIQALFENAGWASKVEMFDADVYVHMGNMELAIEVAMGNNPREIEHVEKHLETFDSVWIACRNQEVSDGLRQRLEENNLLDDRVVFRLLRDFNSDQLPPS